MGALFGALRERVESNAERAVETYLSEVGEYQAVPAGGADRIRDALQFELGARVTTIPVETASLATSSICRPRLAETPAGE